VASGYHDQARAQPNANGWLAKQASRLESTLTTCFPPTHIYAQKCTNRERKSRIICTYLVVLEVRHALGLHALPDLRHGVHGLLVRLCVGSDWLVDWLVDWLDGVMQGIIAVIDRSMHAPIGERSEPPPTTGMDWACMDSRPCASQRLPTIGRRPPGLCCAAALSAAAKANRAFPSPSPTQSFTRSLARATHHGCTVKESGRSLTAAPLLCACVHVCRFIGSINVISSITSIHHHRRSIGNARGQDRSTPPPHRTSQPLAESPRLTTRSTGRSGRGASGQPKGQKRDSYRHTTGFVIVLPLACSATSRSGPLLLVGRLLGRSCLLWDSRPAAPQSIHAQIPPNRRARSMPFATGRPNARVTQRLARDPL